MRLPVKIATAAMMGVIVAVGLSMVEAPADKVAADFQHAAAMAITGFEQLETAGILLVEGIAAGVVIWRLVAGLPIDFDAANNAITSDSPVHRHVHSYPPCT
jgi:hypothetical protein